MSKEKTYLALGDSYTIGENVSLKEAFPSLLSGKCAWESPRIIATTGWTSKQLLNAISQQSFENAYDYVSVLIGVNNQYQGKSLIDFKTDLEQIILFGLSKTQNTSFFLMSIPDYGVSPFGAKWNGFIASELKIYNRLIEEMAGKYKLIFVDVNTISKKAKHDTSLLAADLLHPSSKMYSLWVEEIIKALYL